MNNKFPCKNCGHYEVDHFVKKGFSGYGRICWKYGKLDGIFIRGACSCTEYVMDNLSYLEKLYEEKYR